MPIDHWKSASNTTKWRHELCVSLLLETLLLTWRPSTVLYVRSLNWSGRHSRKQSQYMWRQTVWHIAGVWLMYIKKKHKVTTLFSTATADRICCERDGCYDDLTLLKWCFYSVWNHLKQVKGKTAKAFTCTAQTNISFTYIKMMLLFSAEPNEPSQGQICASF